MASIGGGGSDKYIAKVDSDATGGGYYNCHLQTLDATHWNTTSASVLSNASESTVVVMNLAEIDGVDTHELEQNDRMMVWKVNDDEGNSRYVGIPCQKMGTSANAVSGTGASYGGRFIYRWFGEW